MHSLTLHGQVPAFSEIGKEIKKSIKRGLRRAFKGEDQCDFCKRVRPKHQIVKDYLGRRVCADNWEQLGGTKIYFGDSDMSECKYLSVKLYESEKGS